MRRQLPPALGMLLVLTLLAGLAYPAVVTAIAQVGFRDEANGSLVTRGGAIVGSRWIGQAFSRPDYFHPRPSAADYDGSSSTGSNHGPTNAEFLATVARRIADYRTSNGLGRGTEVPVDAVTASGSGLDPHISVANARLQAPRVATARGRDLADVLALIDENVEDTGLGFLGAPGVNVLRLNLALDG